MALLVDLARALSVLNLVVLLGLTYVWGRNWLTFRSSHALGLVLFALFLLGENALATYYFIVNPTLSAWFTDPQAVPRLAQLAMVSLRAVEFAGLLVLSWVTWD